jgi:hypothetical protein
VRRTRHRADSNHWEILAELKKVTVVRDIHNYGGGMGDILALNVRTRQPVFLEVKPPGKWKLTVSEAVFKLEFGACSILVQSVDEALDAVGVMAWGMRTNAPLAGPTSG